MSKLKKLNDVIFNLTSDLSAEELAQLAISLSSSAILRKRMNSSKEESDKLATDLVTFLSAMSSINLPTKEFRV
jgi:hypothetical protein